MGGEEIDPAGRRRALGNARTADRGGDPASGLVLLDVAGIEQRDGDRLDTGFAQGRQLDRAQDLPFAKNHTLPAQRMGQDAARGGLQRDLAESHSPAARSVRPRKVATISAMIETAI